MASAIYFAPGRVNLIGEHLDYNGGLVMPAALTIGIKLTVTPLTGNYLVLRSVTHAFELRFDLADEIMYNKTYQWANYPLGVIAHLQKEGYTIPACELLYESNLPEGSGLSSSAAVEVVTAFALLQQQNVQVDLVWLANFCKQVENEFIGVQCGIMDQYSVALGKKDNALLLDCTRLHHQYIPFELGDYRLVVMDTLKPRSLIHSKYNERKAECEEALRILQGAKPELRNLCEASPVLIDLLTDETIRRRAKHVITENLRVKESTRVLEMNDLSTFGRLMNASHVSLRDDYEVSGPELDNLVETAQQIKGCLGARMTGAGFGGCAIAIVHSSMLEQFTAVVSSTYQSTVGHACNLFVTDIGDGVKMI